MLNTTLSMKFITGSNLKGTVAGANWSFLLPTMKLERVVCFGMPSQRTKLSLSQYSRDLVILAKTKPLLAKINEDGDNKLLKLPWKPGMKFPQALNAMENTVDLVLLIGKGITQSFYSNPALTADLLRLMKPEGAIYLEVDNPLERFFIRKKAFELAESLGKPKIFWAYPYIGELHTAVPAEDRTTIAYFMRNGLYQPEAKRSLLAQVKRRIGRKILQDNRTWRHSILVFRSGDLDSRQPPEYLRTIASQFGVDLSCHRWGLAAHGEYSTRKVLFFLFHKDSQSPEYVVKIVRDPAMNARLENEYRALSEIEDLGREAAIFLPKPAFFGYHHSLAMLGETAVDGTSFRKKTLNRPDCPYARSVVQQLTNLGTLTADRISFSPAMVAETFTQLFDQYENIYKPAKDERTFIEKQITTLGLSNAPFPLVFQHGDPGTWNILVTPQGDAVFLDWEAAESQGVPLWDLFYFLRSFSVGIAKKAGIHDSILGFAQQFLSNDPFSQFARESVLHYCHETGVSPEYIEPLFYTCWMHRSLKEANRLEQGQLQKGHYVNLLRFCIQQRNSIPIASFFMMGHF